MVFGAPLEFVLFAATLLGIALFHHRTLFVALTGLTAILAYKFLVVGFHDGTGIDGLVGHLRHEWVIIANLGLLLTGFAILSRHFEQSRLPDLAPNILPDGWLGGLTLLALVFIGSGFLDNIAAALIGATVARHVYNGRVSLGYLTAIVASSNAGGAGSVVGDTTTTMMWIAGHSPLEVLHGYVGAAVCFVVFALPAAAMQQRFHPIRKHSPGQVEADWTRIWIVVAILVAAIASNVTTNIVAPHMADQLPIIGMAVWGMIILASVIRLPDFRALFQSVKGTIFLLSLVLCASLMPVEALPPASWETTFSLGFISAVFDNIPLTALALNQGGYDWGFLAYAVGFGGSMVWFGSSAGVAVSNLFPESKSVLGWLRTGWFLPAAYLAGFFAMLGTLGWVPE
ncbi:MAG: citrate transporter [Alphaproteobacteria bacterium]|nr:citrate transporter [Alphaproteobacteria bacterium]